MGAGGQPLRGDTHRLEEHFELSVQQHVHVAVVVVVTAVAIKGVA